MTDTPRRHPNVVNAAELKPFERLVGTRIGASALPIGRAAGMKQLGATLYEVPPGRTAMPRHFHCANEEAVFVLDGTGQARIGEATVEIRAGDLVALPAGPEHAHQIVNTGTVPLRYLAMSTQDSVDVLVYPDSKKVMATGAAPGTSWFEPQWVRGIYEQGTEVEYLKGEKVD